MKTEAYAILSIQWHMPRHYVEMGYGNMPQGGRFIIWACCVEWPFKDYASLYPSIPKGYCSCIDFKTKKKPRKFSAQAKASIRKKRLAERVQKKMPLFAAQAIERSIDKKPDYFDPQFIAGQDILFEEELARRQHEIDMSWISL